MNTEIENNSNIGTPVQKEQLYFRLSLMLISGLFVILLSFVPLALDDLWFLDNVRADTGWGAFTEACSTLAQRIYTDTGRLGNMISPIFLALLPKFIYNLLSGIAFYFLVEGICRLVQIRVGELRSYMVLFFCLICLPWYDYLLIVTYGINYLWAGTLAVWAAYCLLNADKYHSAAAGSVCFIAGWMHEGFGVPLSTAAIILLLTEHKNRGYSKLTILTIAGTCCTALTPAIWRRLFYMSTASGKEYPLSESLLHFGPIVALLVILAALLLKHTITNRRIWKDKRTIFYVVYILAASSLAFKFYCGPRITTSPVIFTFAGIMTLMPDLKLFSRRLFSKICASSIVAFSILHLSYAIHLQYRLQHQFDEIVRLFKASETGQLYINPIPMRADISLYKTTVRQFHESVPRTMFSRYYGRTTSKVMTILPERLQGFTPDKGTPSDYIKGLYIYNNCLVACSGIITDGRIIIILDSEKNRHETRIRLQKFKAADGNNYELVTPHTAILNPSLRIIDAEQ